MGFNKHQGFFRLKFFQRMYKEVRIKVSIMAQKVFYILNGLAGCDK